MASPVFKDISSVVVTALVGTGYVIPPHGSVWVDSNGHVFPLNSNLPPVTGSVGVALTNTEATSGQLIQVQLTGVIKVTTQKGMAGNQGYQGRTGTQGILGTQGDRGYQGQGVQGTQGPQADTSLATPDTNGLMPFSDKQLSDDMRAVVADVTSLDASASPSVGYIYRETGISGEVTKAQADTSIHASSIIRVGHATLGLAPLIGQGLAQFSDLPVVGHVAYLSLSEAGKLQVATPNAGAISLPLAIVRSVVRGTVPYTAIVEWGVKSQMEGVDLRTSLLTESAAMLGGSPSDYGVVFDDFDALVDKGDGNWGSSLGVLSGTLGDHRHFPSYLMTAYRWYSFQYPSAAFGALTSRPWMMESGLYVPVPGDSAHAFMILEIPGGGGSMSVQYPPTNCPDQNIVGGWGGDQLTNSALVYQTNRVVLGPRDGLFHRWGMRSLGDGTVQFRLDGGAWTAPVAYNPGDTAVGARWVFGTVQAYAYWDYFFFGVKVR